VIDLHSHILPGVDDGAATMDDALEMARAARASGVRVVAATPHVRGAEPIRAEAMHEGVAVLRARLADAGIELDVVGGGEVDLDRLQALPPDELKGFGLGGNSGYLLVEFPYQGWPLDAARLLFDVQLTGMTPVLAHPERNGAVQAKPERLRELVEAGALVQVTAGSLVGRFGSANRRTAATLVEQGLAHLLASDAHDATRRGFDLAAAVPAVGDAALASWLAVDMPRAIVDRLPLPPRPEVAKRRRLRRLRPAGSAPG
jgi:protein-tyrosine phosphatase